jgi:uncharacterized protein (TIGR02145 family)
MDSWNDIPMSGRSDPFTVSLGQSTTGPSISFVLRRIAARLNITLTEGSGVTFKTMKVVNLPNKTYYVSRPLTTERSLADGTDDSGRIDGKDAVVPATPTDWIAESATLSSKSVSLYMFENRPGVTGNTNQAAKGKDNAPDTRCTHLVITGEDSSNTYEWTFYLGSDATGNYNIKRNSVYTITATLKNSSVSDVRVVAVAKGINLSANGKANCYIINKADEKYRFDATVRGNGQLPQGGVSADIGKSSDYEAVVLWSMNGSTSGNTATSVVKDVSYDSATGVISFTSVKGSGANAVIALRNKSGNKAILWSWHIWAYTSAGTTHDYPVNNYSGRASIKMMAHNLGVTNTAASAGTHAYQDGLLYQWGRKDPFMSGKNYTGTTDPVKGTDFYADSPTFVYTGTDGSLANGYINPMTYYKGRGVTGEAADWIIGTTKYDNLWGNSGVSTSKWAGTDPSPRINPEYGTKSMFDPCPPGWKVPPRGTWTRYFGVREATASGFINVNASGSFNKGWSFKYANNSSTAWYAASGYRTLSGPLSNVGTDGYSWSASPDSQNSRYGGGVGFNSTQVEPLSNGSYRSSGFPVRCAQE